MTPRPERPGFPEVVNEYVSWGFLFGVGLLFGMIGLVGLAIDAIL